VFKEMGKTRAAFSLIPRPDVVINRNSDHRHRIITVQDDPKPVLKLVFLDIYRRQFELH